MTAWGSVDIAVEPCAPGGRAIYTEALENARVLGQSSNAGGNFGRALRHRARNWRPEDRVLRAVTALLYRGISRNEPVLRIIVTVGPSDANSPHHTVSPEPLRSICADIIPVSQRQLPRLVTFNSGRSSPKGVPSRANFRPRPAARLPTRNPIAWASFDWPMAARVSFLDEIATSAASDKSRLLRGLRRLNCSVCASSLTHQVIDFRVHSLNLPELNAEICRANPLGFGFIV